MRKAILSAAPLLIALTGCNSSAPQDDATSKTAASEAATPGDRAPALPASSETVTTNPTTAEGPSIPPPIPVPPDAPSRSSPPTPPVPPPAGTLTPEAAKGEKGARAVLLTWARALENQDFDLAWAQFRHPPAGRNGFAKWWSRYRTITVSAGDGTVEGAAGSLYYEVPATITGETAEGKPYRLRGTVVLRRVNDVDGASPEQLRWHIDSADLKDATP